ncbi:hypothetical protein BDF19DRAFT_441038 [Syncephalis fuscata]|nr:hypothetical protein BDF19DRAFT_441038 [Syncephalis fuscata]
MKQKNKRRFLSSQHSNRSTDKNRSKEKGNDTVENTYTKALDHRLKQLDTGIRILEEKLNGLALVPSPLPPSHPPYTPEDIFKKSTIKTCWPTGSERRSRLVAEKKQLESLPHAQIHLDFLQALTRPKDTNNDLGVRNRGKALGELYTNRVIAWHDLLQVEAEERKALLNKHQQGVPMPKEVFLEAESLIKSQTMKRFISVIDELQHRTSTLFDSIIKKSTEIDSPPLLTTPNDATFLSNKAISDSISTSTSTSISIPYTSYESVAHSTATATATTTPGLLPNISNNPMVTTILPNDIHGNYYSTSNHNYNYSYNDVYNINTNNWISNLMDYSLIDGHLPTSHLIIPWSTSSTSLSTALPLYDSNIDMTSMAPTMEFNCINKNDFITGFIINIGLLSPSSFSSSSSSLLLPHRSNTVTRKSRYTQDY